MKDFSKIDLNFKITSFADKDDIKFYNINEFPFKIHGMFFENGKYRRIPEKVAESVSENVTMLHTNTSGGRVRFKTDSPYVAIVAKMSVRRLSILTLTGSAGFDIYSSEEGYIKTFIPPVEIEDKLESIVGFGTNKLREITINFPLYSNVSEFYIGLSSNATVLEPTEYKINKPIVYYGSSITQGACASRPGTIYQNIVSRSINADYINLGFSGSALAEDEIAEYIKNLNMSAFVLDYDHNAPTCEHLKNTHEAFFKKVRSKNPNIPIIIMSRPKYFLDEDDVKRLNIIKETYNNAKHNGDKNVYFLGGTDLIISPKFATTVDGIHPTDLGFASIAEALINLFNKIFK